MRGQVLTEFMAFSVVRITPAYAGKSTLNSSEVHVIQDHPCVCGEKAPYLDTIGTARGSPLRMRGKVNLFRFSPVIGRITPAYAGKSLMLQQNTLSIKDHPCVCGEKYK